MGKVGDFFYIDSGDEFWEIGRVTGPKYEIGHYPFEFLIAGFNPDDDFLWDAKINGGIYVDDDNLDAEHTNKHTMISIIFEDRAYWILDKWKQTK